MAEMTSGQRAAVTTLLMSDVSRDRVPIGALTKAQVRAAIDAADTWANDNAASYNAALPQPARTVLTAGLKAQLLTAVILARQLNGA
jgi:hypothetical protein